MMQAEPTEGGAVEQTPGRTVTLLFSDIEGSTRLVRRLGERGYADALAEHRGVLRKALGVHGGIEVDCRADEWFAVFPSSREALELAIAVQDELAGLELPDDLRLRVRMGLHAGEPTVSDGAYLGTDVNRAARICSAGHGGQVLVSGAVRELVGDRFEFLDLGSYALAGIPRPEQIYQLSISQTAASFPPLRAPASGPRNNRRPIGRRGRQEPTLSSAAWRVRAAIPSVESEHRSFYAELGAGLFSAARAVERADAFLDRVDHRRLAERLAEYQQLAVFSEPAALETQRIRDQIAAVEHLGRLRDSAIACATSVSDLFVEPGEIHPADLAPLRDKVSAAVEALDRAVTRAAAIVSPTCFKLKRTRHRGIYTSGGIYIVSYRDDAGTKQVGEFVALADAKRFRTETRVAAQMRRVASRSAWVDAERQRSKWGRSGS